MPDPLRLLEPARWIEAAAWTDIMAGAPERLRTTLSLEVACRGSAHLLRAARIDSLLFNRVLGLAHPGADAAAFVAEVVRFYAAARVPRFFVHVPADAARWAASMQQQGLVRFRRPWVKLARGRDGPVPSRDCALPIGPARPDEANVWAEVLCDGLDIGDAAVPVLASTVGRAGWTTLAARDGDTVVGAAAMFVRDGLANLAGASTVPSHRCRGIQGALMARRVAMALDLGCTVIASETGIAVLGQPNSSGNNMLRCGLEVVSTIDHYTQPQTRW